MKLIASQKNFKLKNLPNILTLLRLIFILPIILFLELENITIPWILILIGGATDYFDGYFAKKLDAQSRFGAIIDPLADKVFIVVPLIFLSINQIVPYWSVCLIIIREFLITEFRNLQKDGLPASRIAKFKTFFLFISLILIFSPFQNHILFILGLIFYWIGFILTMLTILSYLRSK